MVITSERLSHTFSEGGAQEIYQEIRAENDFLGFARRYVFDSDYRVARSALCFYPELMDELKRTLEAMDIDYYKPAVKCARSRILNGKLK